jgi:hypothetical protein
VDPLAAVVALVALAGGLWAGYLSLRALRWQETNATEAAQRLVLAVRDAERDARRQLLGGHDRTINVDFQFRPAPSHNAQLAAPTGHLEQVVSYYQDLRPGRMVITGAPGAGKTVLAVELILGLLEGRGPDDPVPVRLSAASSWDPTRPVERWLAEYLVNVYRLPPDTADVLVTARMVLPVVDGLDEMDPDPQPGYNSRTAQALRALNTYQNNRTKADLVLTCRSGQYEALEAIQVWAEDAARVQISAVSPGKAHQFIHRRVTDATRWQKVLDTIDNNPDGPLAQGLSTPWRLTLAVTVYEQRDPRTGIYLRDPNDLTALEGPEAIRDHLLSLFIAAASASQQPAKEPTYSADEVQAWLTVLATYLNRNATTPRTLGGKPLSGTDIVPHELWPLAGTRRPRALNLAILAALWLIASPLLLIHVPIGLTLLQILDAGPAASAIIWSSYAMWATIWPKPVRFNLDQLRTRTGRLKLAGGSIGGLILGLILGLVIELKFGFTAGLTAGLTFGLTLGLTGAVWVLSLFWIGSPGELRVRDLRHIVGNNLAFGLISGLIGGPIFGSFSGLTAGFIGSLTLALTLGLTIGLGFGLPGFRYIALLMCTRKRTTRWLPWRLGTFLNWCYVAGLIRIAGIAYQFRHRELQDYLARDHTPDLASRLSSKPTSP